MRRLGAIVTTWNGDPFVIPHCKMLLASDIDRIVVLQGAGPLANYRAEFPAHYPLTHDGSRERIAALGLQIVEQRATRFGADLYNQGLELLQDDCDVAFRFDVDMFMSPADLRRITKFVRETDHESYRLDFKPCTLSYYYDFEHGLRDGPEVDHIALVTHGRYQDILHYPTDNEYIVNWPDFTVHHFRGWKGEESNWVFGGRPSSQGATADEWLRRYGDNGKWFTVPPFLRKAIEEQTWEAS